MGKVDTDAISKNTLVTTVQRLVPYTAFRGIWMKAPTKLFNGVDSKKLIV